MFYFKMAYQTDFHPSSFVIRCSLFIIELGEISL